MKFNKGNAKHFGRLGGLSSASKRRERAKEQKTKELYAKLKNEKFTGFYKINGFIVEFKDGEDVKIILN